MCFVDIDNKSLELPEDLPKFPHCADLYVELVQILDVKKSKVISKKDNIDTRVLKGPSSPRKSINKDDQSNKMEILQQSEAFAKIQALAKKTGVWSSIEEFSDLPSKDTKETKNKDPTSMNQKEVEDLLFNNTIREVFLNHFLHIFSSYETFVIQPTQDMESWLSNRESMQTFDKSAFLNDQPEGYLPFLSSFTETQTFALLIDNKILAQWEDPDPNLRIFDSRLKMLKERQGENITHTYSPCTTILDTGK